MRLLEEMILREGEVLPGGILKVGSFLNQLIDTDLLASMARCIADSYADEQVTKVVTIEASGIAIAAATGMAMHVPVLFAKKRLTSNVDDDVLVAPVHSFTHDMDYHVVISSRYLSANDRVLLVDDFLANGHALRGIMSLCTQAGATIVGAAIQIEKCFTGAGDALRSEGLRIESLAAIEAMTEDGIVFRT